MPLQVRGLGLRLGDATVLDDVSFDLGPEGTTVIMGPNGAGKSLLLRILHGLQPPSGGTVSWNGAPPTAVTRQQALVFQTPVLLRRSVVANVDFVLKARGLPRTDAGDLLERVNLSDKAAMPARRLSGGERQRLALARALATRPQVLLLDEPTASLDPAATQAIERIVADASARGVRIIFVTHDVGQAKRLADDVLFLNRGRVVEHTPAAQFFPAPVSEAGRAYLAGRLFL